MQRKIPEQSRLHQNDSASGTRERFQRGEKMNGINMDIILEQIEMVIEKAIAENEAVLVSLGKERQIGEYGELNTTWEAKTDGPTNREFLQIAN